MKEEKKQFSIRLEKKTATKIDEIAEAESCSRNSIISTIINYFFDKKRKKRVKRWN